jgi:hypothetical protein
VRSRGIYLTFAGENISRAAARTGAVSAQLETRRTLYLRIAKTDQGFLSPFGNLRIVQIKVFIKSAHALQQSTPCSKAGSNKIIYSFV